MVVTDGFHCTVLFPEIHGSIIHKYMIHLEVSGIYPELLCFEGCWKHLKCFGLKCIIQNMLWFVRCWSDSINFSGILGIVGHCSSEMFATFVVFWHLISLTGVRTWISNFIHCILFPIYLLIHNVSSVAVPSNGPVISSYCISGCNYISLPCSGCKFI